MTSNPFRYGEAIEGDFFTGRYREKEYLVSELCNGHNVILSGPPEYGKSSLARRVIAEIEHRGIITVYIDLEKAYSPIRLIEIFLNELLKAAFRQTKDLKNFIQELSPEVKKKLYFKIERTDELILDLNETNDLVAIANTVMELAQYAADYKKRQCIICFDEISQGGNLPESVRQRFIQLLNQHPGVSYLLVSLDNKIKNIAKDIAHVSLDTIEERYLRAYIKTRFENTGFRLNEELIDEIFDTTQGHPGFTQMLCRQLWNQTNNGKVISSKSITQAIDAVLEIQSDYYSDVWSDLSLHQKNLLLAVCKGGGLKIFSQDYVTRFGLGSFSTVQKSMNRLLIRKVLTRNGENYQIRDMFFRQWLTRRML